MAKLRRDDQDGSAAFPTRQLVILALCRICEPIAFMSIFPYIYYMIESFKITTDDRQIAVYAGMVTSAFTFAEFSTGVLWGRLSDKIGRKPVLLTGLAGTGLSMLIFGFAPNLPVALIARALGGLLNGNIGVLATTVAEIVKKKEHEARAYSIMPFVWCIGSILGPILGGALAQPCISYPALFARGTLFDRFPYLLPNLICTTIVAFSFVVGLLFLEETHEDKKDNPDAGREIGKWIVSNCCRCSTPTASKSEKAGQLSEVQSLIDENEFLPSYQSTETSPLLMSTTSAPVHEQLCLDNIVEITREKPKAFTKQVVVNVVAYGILAYHTITMDSLLPVFLSSPDGDGSGLSLPFKFIGGFGLSTKQVGLILTMQGIYSMFATIVLFPIVVRKLGPLGLFRTLAFSYPLLYFITPYLVLLPENVRSVGIYAIIIWKCTFANFAFPAHAILLKNVTPSDLVRGTINGVAASTASLCRAMGPTISGALYSLGLQLGISGLAWWFTAFFTISGAVISLWMTDSNGRMDEKSEEDEEACHIESISSERRNTTTELNEPTLDQLYYEMRSHQ